MSLLEASRMAFILRADPSTAIAAAVEGWQYPMSREALLLADLYDLTVRANSDAKAKPKPHPMRPFTLDSARTRERMGNTGGRTRAEVVEILARYGAGSTPV